MTKDLMLVGSVPCVTAEEVFTTFGSGLGAHLAAMPDGEVGPRQHWISKVHYQVMAGHPEFEILRRPAYENGAERLNPRGPGDSWLFKVRDGVDCVSFGDPGWRLGYARDALNSYFVFRTLREKGVLGADLRFQVSIPSVNSVIAPRVFPTPGDLDRIKPGYLDAVHAELQTIVGNIPAEDLAIQWDCATELMDGYGALEGFDPDTAIDRNMAQFHAMCPSIPEMAGLGFHLCFGTLGGWPRFAPDDLSGAVKMANAFIEHAGRRVDWVHIPVLDRSDEAFFAPLADLRPGGTKIYLGMVHNMDGFSDRLAAARKFLPEFGLGAFCGFGREAPETLPAILSDHLKAAEIAGF
jgi:hypothetical protein